MTQGLKRWSLVAALAVLVAGLGESGRRLWSAWRHRSALAEIRGQIQAGRHGVAARGLTALLAREPDSGEAAYLLGVCEKARGRIAAASEAWSRVPPGSAFAAPAILGRAAALVDRGRLADAERLVTEALEDPRTRRDGLCRFLAPLYWQEGRIEDALRLIEADWEELDRAGGSGSDQAVELVRLHVAVGLGTASTEAVRAFLERAGRLAPDDDRVWLGQANLAIRQAAWDQAARGIEACLRRRPEDIPTWRARLDWAVGTGQIAAARAALAHLPAVALPPSRVQRLAAWLAAHRGDVAAECRAWEQLLESDPGDGAALDRLAELALRDGDPARAAALRDRKSTLDPLRIQYKELFLRNQPVQDAQELARLAEQLGSFFAARAFAGLAAAAQPARLDLRATPARLKRLEADHTRPGPTLAGLLAQELAWAIDPHPRPAPAPAPDDSSAPVRFQDDAARAGLTHVFANGASALHQLPEYLSGGIGLIDFDGDGWLDVYAAQGGPFPPPTPRGTALQAVDHHGQEARAAGGDRLFRNRRDGSFADVTESSGLGAIARGYTHGVAVGDYDNDGHSDVFLTRWRSYALYRNRGDGCFEDVTIRAGLSGDREWPTSAAFADLDNDGDLDLYVCHYLRWDEDHPRLCHNPQRGIAVSCDPRAFEALSDHIFRNDSGRFTDVTDRSGFVDRDGRGLGVVAVDVDDDNRVDLFIANDLSANYLLRNSGGMRFDEQGLTAGVACNAQGGQQAGMGVAAGDLDGDGRPELAVTNFFNESTTLFHNLGDGQFADHTTAVGLAVPSRDRLGFGAAFLDANNDGRLDLLTANGHLNDYRPEVPYAMPVQLLIGDPAGRLNDVTARAGPPLSIPHIGRGLAAGDLDNDGRLDALLVVQGEPLVYLHNRTAGGHSLTIALEGTASNRDGVGARLVVEAGGSRQVAHRLGGGSYLSAGDPRLHFGLGQATRVDRLEVRWPSGRIDRFRDLALDRGYRIREGDPQPIPLPGW